MSTLVPQEPDDDRTARLLKFSGVPKDPGRNGEPGRFRSLLRWCRRTAQVVWGGVRQLRSGLGDPRTNAERRLADEKAREELESRAENIRAVEARLVDADLVSSKSVAEQELYDRIADLKTRRGLIVEAEVVDENPYTSGIIDTERKEAEER